MALSELGKKLAKKFSTTKCLSIKMLADDDQVEEAVDETVKKASDLTALLEALGVADGDQAISQVASLNDAKGKLEKALAELAEKTAVVEQVDQAQAQNDVGAALSAKGLDEAARPALEAHRAKLLSEEVTALTAKLGDKQPDGKQLTEAKETGRKKFLTHYGVPDEKHAALLKLLTVDKSGQDLPVGTPPGHKPTLLSGDPPKDEKRIEVTAQDEGRNDAERLRSALLRQDPAFAKMSYSDQLKHVFTLRRSGHVVITGLGAN